MDKETASLLLQFLQRVDLKGSEVPAFNKAVSALAPYVQEEPLEDQNDET